MSAPTVLPAAALSRLVPRPARGRVGLRRSALWRVALYALLFPVTLAVSVVAGRPVPWPVLAAIWCGWSLVTGRTVAAAGGRRWYGWPLVAGAGLAVSVLLAGGGAALAVGGRAAPPFGGDVRTALPFGGDDRSLPPFGGDRAVLPFDGGDLAALLTGGDGAAYGLPPGLVPLLVALPLLELWIWWHLSRVAAGLVRYDDRDGYQRYVRALGWATLAGLLPALAAGVALAAAATRLPYGLAAHPDAPVLVLAIACGVLLVGVVAIGRLLAARRRPGLAALVAWCPVAGALGSLWGQLLPGVAIGLAVGYTAGLVIAAYVLVDPRAAG